MVIPEFFGAQQNSVYNISTSTSSGDAYPPLTAFAVRVAQDFYFALVPVISPGAGQRISLLQLRQSAAELRLCCSVVASATIPSVTLTLCIGSAYHEHDPSTHLALANRDYASMDAAT